MRYYVFLISILFLMFACMNTKDRKCTFEWNGITLDINELGETDVFVINKTDSFVTNTFKGNYDIELYFTTGMDSIYVYDYLHVRAEEHEDIMTMYQDTIKMYGNHFTLIQMMLSDTFEFPDTIPSNRIFFKISGDDEPYSFSVYKNKQYVCKMNKRYGD